MDFINTYAYSEGVSWKCLLIEAHGQNILRPLCSVILEIAKGTVTRASVLKPMDLGQNPSSVRY